MKSTTLYLPIGSASLPHYFNKAIILPAGYYTNKIADLQNRFSGSFFLTHTISIAEADCFLELVLTEKEIMEAERLDAGYLIHTALPISRVRNVYFTSKAQKDTTVFNINAGAAYLPERLVKVVPKLKEPVFSLPQPIARPDRGDLAAKANRFDILLGGIAFMKMGRKQGFNYPKDYFGTLGYFNALIREQTLNAEKQGLVSYNEWLTGVFINRKDTPWSQWQSLIYEKIDTESIEKLASRDNLKLEKKYGVIQLHKMDPESPLYTLSVLATYGNKTSLSINELIRLLDGPDLTEEKAEELALIFGLHTRYGNLRKEYQDSVKFKLESQLDYYTIESIYQFVFNGIRENRRFEYLDSWIPVQQPLVSEDVPHFQILDTDVLSKKKAQPADFFRERFGVPLRDLQVHTEDFAKNIFETAMELARSENRQAIQELKTEILALNQELEPLRQQKQEMEQKAAPPDPTATGAQAEKETSGNNHSDELESMELKELKKIAKAKGINQSTISLVKPTKKGLETFITLIRNTPTLL